MIILTVSINQSYNLCNKVEHFASFYQCACFFVGLSDYIE